MITATSLYEIQQEYLDIEQALFESGGEVTDELAEAMALNESDMHEKADAYAHIINQKEGRIAALDAEIKRLQDRKKVERNSIDRLKDRLAQAVSMFGAFDTTLHKYSNRKSTSVEVDSVDELPPVFVVEKVSRSADKAEIKKALKAGDNVPGARLVEKESVQIR